MLTFTIPSPPGKNALYRNVGAAERERARSLGRTIRGRRRTLEYQIWRNAAEWAMRLDGNKTRTWERILGPVSVEITVGTRHDNDALVPAIFDLFTMMRVWLDDRQVAEHTVRRGAPSREVTVTIRAIEARAA